MSEPLDAGLSPGTMVGGYRIERRLGQGGMGTVYAAVDSASDARVAVKVLRRAFAEDPTMAARFEREARAVSEIRHPAILDISSIGRLDDGRPYLVMPLLEGCSLREEIDARGKLSPDEAWWIARAVAEALTAVHAAGVIHRDLKPDNVFLEHARDGVARRVRVLDFGIAKIEAPVESEPMKITATGVPIGTPAYMAPEQWWNAGVSPRTEQYALGAVLYEMLAGRPPFTSQSFAELVQQHVHEPPPPLAAAGAEVPEAAEAVVRRMLSKSAEDRFASMAAVIEAGDAAFPALAPADAEAIAGATSTLLRPSVKPARPPPAARALRRYLGIHAAIAIFGSLATFAVGYAGYARHQPIEWIKMGGYGQIPLSLWLLVGIAALAGVARERAATGKPSLAGFWVALFPSLVGAFSTYTGWHAILNHLPRTRALDHFTIFNEGTYEANAARFLGFAIASMLCLSLAALPGVSGMAGATVTLPRAPGVRPNEASVAAIALVIIALAAAIVGAPSATLVAGVAAATLAVGLQLPTVHAQTAARDELERAVAGVLAVALAAAVGITRIEAREAALWDAGLTRADRVAEIVAVRGERDTTIPIAAASLLVVAVIEALRIRRLARLGAIQRPRTATAALATVLALGATFDLIQHGRFIGKRDELRAEIAAQFTLFTRLDPPPGDALDAERFPPHRATALQITRDVVAVDGRGVARLAALATADGATQVASDLNHALAQAALAQEPASVDLSISIDREVPGDTLARILHIARAAGVRRVDLLLTRGAAPKLTKGPPEIDIVVPSDFVAIPADLADDGAELAGAGRFGAIAPALVAKALSAAGPVRIAVR